MFIVAAECGTPSGTCFCTSMGTGPAASEGYDLALTELYDQGGHRFVVRIGSEQGAEVLSAVPLVAVTPGDRREREEVLAGAEASMGRRLETEGLAALLARNLEHPRWDDVAERCLACGNCTLVCPTCFCSDVHDTSELTGEVVRTRTWSSCFDLEHSYVHGGAVRKSTSVAISPVADPQAVDLVGSVRHLRLHRVRTVRHLVPGRHRPDRGGRCNPALRRGSQFWERPRWVDRMRISSVAGVVSAHPLLAGVPPATVAEVAGCAQNVAFAAGTLLLAEGDPADSCTWCGGAGLPSRCTRPARGPVVIETVGPGSVVGWSWLVPPYTWRFDAKAIEPVGAIALNAACLRDKADADPVVGYALMARVAAVLVDRLQATRLRLLDVYGHGQWPLRSAARR